MVDILAMQREVLKCGRRSSGEDDLDSDADLWCDPGQLALSSDDAGGDCASDSDATEVCSRDDADAFSVSNYSQYGLEPD